MIVDNHNDFFYIRVNLSIYQVLYPLFQIYFHEALNFAIYLHQIYYCI